MSNELKCSPSDWKVAKIKSTNIGYCVDIMGDYPDDLICSVWGNTSEECEANANLIAASKDLYNALVDILEWGKTKNGKFSYNTSEEKKLEIQTILQKANTNYKP